MGLGSVTGPRAHREGLIITVTFKFTKYLFLGGEGRGWTKFYCFLGSHQTFWQGERTPSTKYDKEHFLPRMEISGAAGTQLEPVTSTIPSAKGPGDSGCFHRRCDQSSESGGEKAASSGP